ncbi:hypothetical protein [Cyanobium sp. T1B-Tous]|uniref:hypothetical protein n=1 Tax=Cyanobium sp. T1B-Tous TaxID=2823721 RepID=UPI0028F432D6|nr:hypothetical protein [Cyanobium sp. T1B-Tous]
MAAEPLRWVLSARRPVLNALALSACGLLLASCSGTRFGDQLARSFSTPQAQPEAPPPAPTQTPVPGTTAATSKGAKAPKAPVPPVPSLPRATQPSKPAPYRITIQLPSADPAAPAEAVTEALRAAGVSFEVEMIERIGASAGGQAPPAAPAPAAPTVTPAPAPR